MKKITLFSILCMLLFQTNAQNNNYYNRMQHVFGNIDKAKVTTGYLKEFGVRFNTVENYDGVLALKDTNLIHNHNNKKVQKQNMKRSQPN
ncbi:hypothetical protein [Polaribacter sp.]|uniref:hypothetical protein n=1 Tax=Polaribacter sp. TaxID=1920175 RepID=UPI003F6C9C77